MFHNHSFDCLLVQYPQEKNIVTIKSYNISDLHELFNIVLKLGGKRMLDSFEIRLIRHSTRINTACVVNKGERVDVESFIQKTCDMIQDENR